MAKISPFSAVYYDSNKVGNISDVIIPPYDNIPKSDEPKYRQRSPYNFSHILLPQAEQEDYAHAKELLGQWRQHGILKTLSHPGYFLYQQIFPWGQGSHRRNTLMCTVELSDYSEGIIRPHENTHGKYKADRLNILRKTQHNLSHVFGMVKDPDGTLATWYDEWQFRPPILKGKTDDGVEHAVWFIAPDKTKGLQEFFADKSIYIVDGHHRYESSLLYAKEIGAFKDTKHAASRMLFSIANGFDPALIVMPTHRSVAGAGMNVKARDLEAMFSLEPTKFETMVELLAKPSRLPHFGLFVQSKLYLASPHDWQKESAQVGRSVARLSVHWSDENILRKVCGIQESERSQKIQYEKDAKKLWDERKDSDLLIFHPTPSVLDVTDVADEKKFMPQKSTYFFPKLAAGLILRDHSLQGA